MITHLSDFPSIQLSEDLTFPTLNINISSPHFTILLLQQDKNEAKRTSLDFLAQINTQKLQNAGVIAAHKAV